MIPETALLVIDIQVGMFDENYPIHAGDMLLERVGTLISKARAADVPVIYVQHNENAGEPLETNSEGWNVHPSIQPRAGDVAVQKFTPDAFHETNLQEELTKRGTTRLVLTGIQSDCCVEATCRRAHVLGYDVTVVEDAHSTFDSETTKAEEIIRQCNESFRSIVKVCPSDDIQF